jgi:hypothetical protein
MSQKSHTSLIGGKREIRSCCSKRTGCTRLRCFFRPLACLVFLPLLALFAVPSISMAPLHNATAIRVSSDESIRAGMQEEDIRRIFARFQMPVDAKLIHEMTVVGMENQVDPRLVAAIIVAESSGNPLAVSNQRAIGLMQINAKVWARKLDFAKNNPFDPSVNLRLGVPILKECLKQYRWLDSALAAYVGDLDCSREETATYVNRVIRIFEKSSGIKAVRKGSVPVRAAGIESAKNSSSSQRQSLAESLMPSSPATKQAAF